jgi:hypothetical protein
MILDSLDCLVIQKSPLQRHLKKRYRFTNQIAHGTLSNIVPLYTARSDNFVVSRMVFVCRVLELEFPQAAYSV